MHRARPLRCRRSPSLESAPHSIPYTSVTPASSWSYRISRSATRSVDVGAGMFRGVVTTVACGRQHDGHRHADQESPRRSGTGRFESACGTRTYVRVTHASVDGEPPRAQLDTLIASDPPAGRSLVFGTSRRYGTGQPASPGARAWWVSSVVKVRCRKWGGPPRQAAARFGGPVLWIVPSGNRMVSWRLGPSSMSQPPSWILV